MTVIEQIIESVSKTIENALGVSPLDILVQILGTILLVLIVKKFFWKKVVAYLDGRRAAMDQEFEKAKAAQLEAEEVRAKSQEELLELKKRGDAMMSQARIEADREHQEIVQEARQEAIRILENANRQIEIDKEHARRELRGEVVEIATMMAGKILDEELDPNKYRDLAISNFESGESS